MSSQHASITETIIGIKRSFVRQERGDFPEESIDKPSNRGNKLMHSSQYVHEGSLGSLHRTKYSRKRVKHSHHYERDILHYNPPAYDSDGYEVEEGSEAVDADVSPSNPFGDVHLESLLCPLRHPCELASHPSLAEPYKSKIIKQMVDSIEDRLRRERVMLYKAKRLHREFLGDIPWLPLGFLEDDNDHNIFLPQSMQIARPAQEDSYTKNNDTPPEENHLEKDKDTSSKVTSELPLGGPHKIVNGGINGKVNGEVNGNINGQVNGGNQEDTARKTNGGTKGEDGDINMSRLSPSPTPPRRMTTRAQAAQHSNDDYQSSSGSLSDSDSESYIPHPLYVIPNVPNDSTCGLPPQEAEEMHRVLWSYIQKQEETVRGFERIYSILIKAKRMKDDVWEWCQAEAHMGELSDSEDWWDDQKWGLKPGELKKGTLAEEDEEKGGGGGGKKSKGRRT